MQKLQVVKRCWSERHELIIPEMLVNGNMKKNEEKVEKERKPRVSQAEVWVTMKSRCGGRCEGGEAGRKLLEMLGFLSDFGGGQSQGSGAWLWNQALKLS